jgi:hypothetical protein
MATTNPKRYRISGNYGYDTDAFDEPAGEWVRYEEVQVEIERLSAIEELARTYIASEIEDDRHIAEPGGGLHDLAVALGLVKKSEEPS